MSAQRLRLPSLAVAALAVAALTAACGSSSSSGSGSGSGSGSNGAGGSAASSAPSTSHAPAPTGSVTISEREFSLTPVTAHARAGRVVIRIHNAGAITHALKIENGGPGGKDLASAAVSPGSTATLVAHLKKGSYEMYCPIGNHKSLGMKGTLIVS